MASCEPHAPAYSSILFADIGNHMTFAGVRIAGLHQPLTSGEVVRLQRSANRRCFRVVWSNQVGGAYQAGLEAIEPLEAVLESSAS